MRATALSTSWRVVLGIVLAVVLIHPVPRRALLVILKAAAGFVWRDDSPPEPDLVYIKAPLSETEKLVIFVHGFGSDGKSAWTSTRTRAYWPELVAADSDFADSAVLLANYSSPVLRGAGTIEQAALALGTAIEDEKIYTRFSHISFVAHSTGGLLVRRMLVRLLNKGDSPAVRRVAVVFFFATPTSGGPISELVAWLSANPQTKDLDPSETNTFLQALDNDWEDLLRRRAQQTANRPFVYCAYEIQNTQVGAIVPRIYSKTPCDEAPLPFNRDHVTLVKPDNVQDAVYRWTKTRLLGASRRRGQVVWDSGERLGELVERLRRAYRDNRVPEEVRFSPTAESTMSQLWIPKAEYRRDSWGELFRAVASDHPCLGVNVVDPARLVELSQAGAVKSCGGRRVCSNVDCSTLP